MVPRGLRQAPIVPKDVRQILTSFRVWLDMTLFIFSNSPQFSPLIVRSIYTGEMVPTYKTVPNFVIVVNLNFNDVNSINFLNAVDFIYVVDTVKVVIFITVSTECPNG